MRVWHIRQLRWYKPERKLELLEFAPVSKKYVDTVSEQVWWVLKEKEKEEIEDFLNWRIQKLSFWVQRKIYSILRNVASISYHLWDVQRNIHSQIETQMNNPGLALEFFIADAIERYGKKHIKDTSWKHSIKTSSQKAPLEFDKSLKVDLLTGIHTRGVSLDLWVQLTTSKSPRIRTKEQDMDRLRERIDSEDKFFNLWNFTEWCQLDMWVLMIVNGEVWDIVSNSDRTLRDAFWEWRSTYASWWPIRNIKQHSVRKWISTIWWTYPFMVYEALKFLQTYASEKRKPKFPLLVRDTGNERFFLEFDENENTIEISYFKQKKSEKIVKKPDGSQMKIIEYVFPEEFEYSVKFYITEKILRRLWIIQRKRNKKTTN